MNRAALASMVLAAAVFLQACGGGDSTTGESSSPQSESAVAALSLQATTQASAQAGGAEGTWYQVLSLQKASEVRIGRTTYDYEFRVLGKNVGAAGTPTWSASIVRAPEGTSVRSGTVKFAATPMGQEQTSTDAIVLRIDRTLAFDASKIEWSFSTDLTQGPPLVLLPGEVITIEEPTGPPLAKPDLVVYHYPGAEPYPIVPDGQALCPRFNNGRLSLACAGSYYSKAYQVANPPACPAGSFMDPRNGGECWSCPKDFIRNASAVTSTDACWKPVTEKLEPAELVKSTGCSAGFYDPRQGGQCWSCPSGYYRTLDSVTSSTACAKGVFGPFSSATQLADPGGACDASSFFDPIDGGTCWKCPSGYRRTAYGVKDSKACARTIETQYRSASFLSGCSQAAVPAGYGPAVRDPRQGGQCWTCPLQLSRSILAVTADNACTVPGGNNGMLWQFPQYPDPGVQRFVRGIAADAFSNAALVDAFLAKRAGDDPARKAELWKKMSDDPNNSAELKAIIFTGLLNAAAKSNASTDLSTRASIAAFENYIRNRRVFVANEAAAMYDYWQRINAKNRFDAARAFLGGFAGLNSSVLGAAPPGDFIGTAHGATGPDERGNEFLSAFIALGALADTAEFKAASTAGAGGFDPTPIVQAWDVINFTLGIKDFVQLSQLISLGKAPTDILATTPVGAGVLGVQLIRLGWDMYVAINVLLEQDKAEKAIRDNLDKAAGRVDLKQILASGSPTEKAMLADFWARATSPHRASPKAGEGKLTIDDVCNPTNPQPDFDREGCEQSLRELRSIVDAAQLRALLPTPK